MSCEYACGRGVRPGITLAEAVALLDRREVARRHEPGRDVAALWALARWCLRFTPRVAPVMAGGLPSGYGLILDMTGCDRLYGGPHRTVEAVVDGLRRLGLTVRAALAPTRAGAEALSRGDGSAVCLVGSLDELRARLDGLGVAALGLGSSEVDGLNEVGIDRVEQLRRVAREEVVSRFGPGVLRRLDLAWGDRRCEGIEPVRRWEAPEVGLRFAGPTVRYEAVQGAARGLCEGLAERLRHRLRSAATLTLRVERLDGDLRVEVVDHTLTLSRPSRDGKHLWAMLRPHVERLHLGHGVEALTLRARQAPRVGHTQLGPRDGRVEDAALAEAEAGLVDVLSARLGPHRVVRPVAVATHVPEAALRWVAAVEQEEGTEAWRHGGTKQEPPEADSPFTPPPCPRAFVPSCLPASRPTWLLDPMEPARVLLLNPEGPVLSLDWRGTNRRLAESIGPERIAPRWWKSPARRVVVRGASADRSSGHPGTGGGTTSPEPPHREAGTLLSPGGEPGGGPDESGVVEPLPPLWSDLAARDYYRVQDEVGLWLWVFRRLDSGRWFVHGVWV